MHILQSWRKVIFLNNFVSLLRWVHECVMFLASWKLSSNIPQTYKLNFSPLPSVSDWECSLIIMFPDVLARKCKCIVSYSTHNTQRFIDPTESTIRKNAPTPKFGCTPPVVGKGDSKHIPLWLYTSVLQRTVEQEWKMSLNFMEKCHDSFFFQFHHFLCACERNLSIM